MGFNLVGVSYDCGKYGTAMLLSHHPTVSTDVAFNIERIDCAFIAFVDLDSLSGCFNENSWCLPNVGFESRTIQSAHGKR
jgi:hypothetical protein